MCKPFRAVAKKIRRDKVLTFIACATAQLISSGSYGKTWYVDSAAQCPGNGSIDAPFCQIQTAINIACCVPDPDRGTAGDTIIVLPGIYGPINFRGKNIVVRSLNPEDDAIVAATIIDGAADDDPYTRDGPVVTFASREGSDSVLSGLTITRGGGSFAPSPDFDSVGGGIYCVGASPIIRRCVIENHHTVQGAGIYLQDSAAIVERNLIRDCHAVQSGGAIKVYMRPEAQLPGKGAHVIIRNNIILCNEAMRVMGAGNNSAGGAIDLFSPAPWSDESSPEIRHNVFAGNTSLFFGSAIKTYNFVPIISHNVFFMNTTEMASDSATVYGEQIGSAVPSHNCFYGNFNSGTNGYGGEFASQIHEGDITQTDPQFASPGHWNGDVWSECSGPFGDYRLQPTSPLIDAGDEDLYVDLLKEVDFDGNRRVDLVSAFTDIGAFEFGSGLCSTLPSMLSAACHTNGFRRDSDVDNIDLFVWTDAGSGQFTDCLNWCPPLLSTIGYFNNDPQADALLLWSNLGQPQPSTLGTSDVVLRDVLVASETDDAKAILNCNPPLNGQYLYMSSGSLTCDNLFVGSMNCLTEKNPFGWMVQSGGAVTIAQNLDVGVSRYDLSVVPTYGTYDLCGGTLTAQNVTIGLGRAVGSFRQAGGMCVVEDRLRIGGLGFSSNEGRYDVLEGELYTGFAEIGFQGGSRIGEGTLKIAGANSSWTSDGVVSVGASLGKGILQIAEGASAQLNDDLLVGYGLAESNGTVEMSGIDSRLVIQGELHGADQFLTSCNITVKENASLRCAAAILGGDANIAAIRSSSLVIKGKNSDVSCINNFTVGGNRGASGELFPFTLNIRDGAQIQANTISILPRTKVLTANATMTANSISVLGSMEFESGNGVASTRTVLNGAVAFEGDYRALGNGDVERRAGTLRMRVNGVAANSHDSLRVSGALTAGGRLALSAVNGTLAIGDRVPIIEYGGLLEPFALVESSVFTSESGEDVFLAVDYETTPRGGKGIVVAEVTAVEEIPFGSNGTESLSGQPVAIATGEFDGLNTGLTDVAVAVANEQGGVLYILGNCGTNQPPPCSEFSFDLVQMIPLANTPVDLTAADYDGDGVDDVAIANVEGSVVIRLAADFSIPITVAAGVENMRAITSGSFNDDKLLDLAIAYVSNESMNSSRIVVLINNGQVPIQFSMRDPIELVGDDSGDLDPIDIDDDKKAYVDIAALTHQTPASGGEMIRVSQVIILRNNGSGDLVPLAPVSLDTTAREITVAELDGDLLPDLLITNSDQRTVSFLLNDQGNGFAGRVDLSVGGFPLALTTGRFNADSDTDFAVTISTTLGPEVHIFENKLEETGQLQFLESDDLGANVLNPSLIASGRVDDDSIDDLIVVSAAPDRAQPNQRGLLNAVEGLRSGAPSNPLCPADIAKDDGFVDQGDLNQLIANWNTGGQGATLAEPEDVVNVADLFILLAAWGACE